MNAQVQTATDLFMDLDAAPQPAAPSVSPSNKRVWAGRIISTLPVLFMLFDSGIKLFNAAPVAEAFDRMGFSPSLAVSLGILSLFCTVLYAIPRTSVLGAVLLTGYLGGAVCSHVRIADPMFSHTLFPVYVATLFWLGLYLREPRLSSLFPFRS